MFFIGVSAGLVAMYKLTGETIKVEVKKIKNKRIGGNSEVTIPVDLGNAGNGAQLKPGKQKKADKKAAKLQKKLEKQHAKNPGGTPG